MTEVSEMRGQHGVCVCVCVRVVCGNGLFLHHHRKKVKIVFLVVSQQLMAHDASIRYRCAVRIYLVVVICAVV